MRVLKTQICIIRLAQL